MFRENKNAQTKIYYKSDDLVTGQSVVFSVWDVLGNTYLSNAPATAEISNLGIYYIDFTTPDIDTYLLVTASYANSSHPKSLVIAIGFPTDVTVFYADPTKLMAATLPFSIFDMFGVIWISGDLLNFGHGFYGTNVNSLKDGTYFLRVPPEAAKFDIPQSFENGL